MARIGDGQPPPSRIPIWPWGGPRSVREKLVDPAQLDRKRRKKGDPRSPPLASAELLDFIGPGHTADEVRLPPPPSPYGEGDAAVDIQPFPDRTFTRQVSERREDHGRRSIESALARLGIPSDKMERMRAFIHREAQMIALVGRVQTETDAVIEKMKQEYKANGSY